MCLLRNDHLCSSVTSRSCHALHSPKRDTNSETNNFFVSEEQNLNFLCIVKGTSAESTVTSQVDLRGFALLETSEYVYRPILQFFNVCTSDLISALTCRCLTLVSLVLLSFLQIGP